jgi:hypothetical protein
MKRKALIVALLCVMGLAAIFIGNAEAGAYYSCKIKEVGSNYGYNYVTLSAISGAFSNVTFLLEPYYGSSKSQLAVFLTAWENSQSVSVYLDGIKAYSICYGVTISPVY